MIIILTYYADGSGKPEVKFFPSVPEQATHVASVLLAAAQDMRQCEVYEITVDRRWRRVRVQGGSGHLMGRGVPTV